MEEFIRIVVDPEISARGTTEANALLGLPVGMTISAYIASNSGTQSKVVENWSWIELPELCDQDGLTMKGRIPISNSQYRKQHHLHLGNNYFQ